MRVHGAVNDVRVCGAARVARPVWCGVVSWRVVARRASLRVVARHGHGGGVGPQDVMDKSFRVAAKRAYCEANPLRCVSLPRLATARELLSTSLQLEKELGSVRVPFIVLHGEGDVVRVCGVWPYILWARAVVARSRPSRGVLCL